MNMKSAHEVLQVSVNASIEEISAAYKKMASLYHPDKVAHLAPEFQEMAEQRMKEINAAYQELKNPNSNRVQRQPEKSVQATVKGINDFTSFAGFSYGDTVQKIHRLMGKPHSFINNLEIPLISTEYYPVEPTDTLGTLSINHHRDTGVITTINLSGTEAVQGLRAKGITDPKLSYFGEHLKTLERTFGRAKDGGLDSPLYTIYHPKNPNRDESSYDGMVSFICYDFDDYICTLISVSWYYSGDYRPNY
jgi:hypothetical protein